MKRRDVEFLSMRWVLLFAVLMFSASVLMNRYVWGDGPDWVQAAIVTALTSVSMAVFGVLQRPPSDGSSSDVP